MYKLFSALLIILLFVGCGHTNQLADYVLRGKKAFYTVRIEPKARSIEVNLQTDKKKDKEEKIDLEKVLDVGSDILNSQKISSIKEYIDTENIINNIAYQLEDALITFLDIKTAGSKIEKPDFLIEIRLRTCKLNVYKNRSSVSIFATAEIIERSTGGLVWENWETYTIPIGERKYGSKKSKSSTETKVLTTAQLLKLSKKEIDFYIGEAAEVVGRKMADTFREDYNEAVKNKVFDKK